MKEHSGWQVEIRPMALKQKGKEDVDGAPETLAKFELFKIKQNEH